VDASRDSSVIGIPRIVSQTTPDHSEYVQLWRTAGRKLIGYGISCYGPTTPRHGADAKGSRSCKERTGDCRSAEIVRDISLSFFRSVEFDTRIVINVVQLGRSMHWDTACFKAHLIHLPYLLSRLPVTALNSDKAMILIPSTPYTPQTLRPILGSIQYLHPYPFCPGSNPFGVYSHVEEKEGDMSKEKKQIWERWSRKVAREILGEEGDWSEWPHGFVAP
jgi:hypothetical protein